VLLTSTSALHGICESPPGGRRGGGASASANPADSGRRYATAGELVSFESGGSISGRILTLLPTRGVDAELWILATWQTGMPPMTAVVNTQSGRMCGLQFGGQDTHDVVDLSPWHLSRADLEVVNALREQLNALVLHADGGGGSGEESVRKKLPAALDAFFQLGGALVARPPVSDDGEEDNEDNLQEADLRLHPGVVGPWPPYDLAHVFGGAPHRAASGAS
jgi:hypothetical protein